MHVEASDIEEIVRLVVQRLRSVSQTAEHFNKLDPTRLKLTQKLITLEQLNGRIQGLQTLEVPRKSVVTPSAMDELRARGVALIRAQKADTTQDKEVDQTLVVMPQSSLSKFAAGPGVELMVELAEPLETANELARRITDRNRRVVWWCERSYEICSIAQRMPAVAVINLTDARDLPAAVEQVRPNLIIADRARYSIASVLNLIAAWKRIAL